MPITSTLIAGQLDVSIAARLEALGGEREVTCGAITSVAFSRSPARALRTFSPTGALVRYGLVELGEGETAWAKRKLFATNRLVEIGLGDDGVTPPDLLFLAPRREPPTLDALAVSARTCNELRDALLAGDGAIALIGLPNTGRATLLSALAREQAMALLEIDARLLAKDPRMLASQLRAIARECKLLARTPLIAHVDVVAELGTVASELVTLVAGPTLFTSTRALAGLRSTRPLATIEMRAPTARQRGALWVRALGGGDDADATYLANRYPLAPGLIVRAATAALARARGSAVLAEHVHAGVRSVLDGRLGSFAKRVDVTQSWDDLVLARDQINTLVESIRTSTSPDSRSTTRCPAATSAMRRCARRSWPPTRECRSGRTTWSTPPGSSTRRWAAS